MHIITKSIIAYTFDELNEDAKHAVKTWLDPFNAEFVLENFKTVTGILGFYDVEPRYSGFWSQGDGASFTGSYRYVKGSTKAIREYAPQDAELHRIADGLQALQKQYFYKLCASLTENYRIRYCHEHSVDIEVYNPENEYQNIPHAEDFAQLCRALMQWLYARLEAEYDYQNSDEAVSETCASNGYEFSADGSII